MTMLLEIKEIAGWIRSIGDVIERGANKGVIAVTNDAMLRAKRQTQRNFKGSKGNGVFKGPRKTGNLMNAIEDRYEIPTAPSGHRPLLQGWIVVRAQKGNEEGSKPYGRIHEFGGDIKRRNRRFLWLKNYGGDAARFKDMTPTDFVTDMQRDPQKFRILYPSNRNPARQPIAWYFGELPKPQKRPKDWTQRRVRPSDYQTKGPGGGMRRPRKAARPKTKWVPLFFLRQKVTMPARPFVRPAIAAAVGPGGSRFMGILKYFIDRERGV